ncbi:hypothetical protein [Actinomadura sp. NTSP31]|uniref:hypothetical protein n=1 Tax=Actinomadura sp. NTSP31 TaxID=1735447 RepID=UPI0035C08365
MERGPVSESGGPAESALQASGLGYTFLRPNFYMPNFSRAYRNGGAETVTTTIRDLTGGEPTTFEQFVRDHRAAFL